MTTIIASKEGILADDKLSGEHYGGPVQVIKVTLLDDGSLLAGAGNWAQIAVLIAYLNAELGEVSVSDLSTSLDESVAVRVMPGGEMMYYDHILIPYPVEDEVVFLGSGAPYAMTAMHLGKSAEAAILIASELDENTGTSCIFYPVPEKPKDETSDTQTLYPSAD